MKAEKAVEDKSIPLFTFAHDLRQQLRSIMMHAQRLERQAEKLSLEDKSKLSDILTAARRQEELIASVVEYDQALHNGMEGETRMPLRLVIQTACLKVDGFRKLQEGTLLFDAASVPEMMVPSGLAKVIEKILHNALKFHSKETPPQVEIETVPDSSGSICIRVKDNGLGIERQYRDRVVEPFQRLNPGSEYPGSGMGLSTCLRLMESIGGNIRIEDHAGSSGVAVVVCIPLTEESN